MVSRNECRNFLGHCRGDIRGEKRRDDSIIQSGDRNRSRRGRRRPSCIGPPFGQSSPSRVSISKIIRDTSGERRRRHGGRRWHVYGCQCDAPNPANHWAARWLIYNAPKLQSQKLSASRFDSFLFPSLFFPSDYGLRNTENIDPPPIVAIIVGREYFSSLGYHLFLLFSIFSYRM